jgi:hypothetical protein
VTAQVMSHSDDKGLVLPPPVAPVQVVVVPITKGSGAEHDAIMARVGAVVAAQFPSVAMSAGWPSYGFWPTTGIILLFLALALQIVGFGSLLITRVYVKRCSEAHAPAPPARIAVAV